MTRKKSDDHQTKLRRRIFEREKSNAQSRNRLEAPPCEYVNYHATINNCLCILVGSVPQFARIATMSLNGRLPEIAGLLLQYFVLTRKLLTPVSQRSGVGASNWCTVDMRHANQFFPRFATTSNV